VAKLADIWNPGAPTTEFEYVRERTRMLEELCARYGRAPTTIERTLDPVIMIRSSRRAAAEALGPILTGGGLDAMDGSANCWLGPPEAIADAFRPYMQIGFTHLIAGLTAPFDAETIEGMAEVRGLLDDEDQPTLWA
jgi:alkanesulfonate monooxygenase SsuD/methylene tetrahydromethanopterin reductase-like flavin-dependent oxidoreductase (luciferase family)